jgi:hypothetical protein
LACTSTISGVSIPGHDPFLTYYGTELTSGAVLRWAIDRVAWHYIQPGKPILDFLLGCSVRIVVKF